MNANVLHAVDSVYLRAFRQNLLDEVLRACVSLKQRLRQSASLATAPDLPAAFRQNYGEIAERLSPLITVLRSMLDQLDGIVHSADQQAGEVLAAPGEVTETMAMLDAAEIEILNVLNEVGKSLGTLPPSIVTWDGCARLRTRAHLRPLTERPCYDSETPIDFCVHPFLMAEYSSNPQARANTDRCPHYLVNEIIPVALLPMLDGIDIEVEARGLAYVSCQPRGTVGG